MKGKACFVVGSTVSLIMEWLFGPWTMELKSLVVIMALDLLGGMILAISGKSKKSASGKLSSHAMTIGLAKKAFMLVVISACHICDIFLNISYLMNVAIISFMVNEILSIMENASCMGLNVKFMEKILDVMAREDENGV